MSKQYVDESWLMKAVGGEDKLRQTMINPAVNFVSGQTTSAISKVSKDTSTYITLEILRYEGANSKVIKKKTFSDQDKCIEFINNDKESRLNKLTETLRRDDPNISDADIKSTFEETFGYQINNEKINTLGTLTQLPIAGLGAYAAGKELLKSANEDALVSLATNVITDATNIITSSVTKIISSGLKNITTQSKLAPKLIKQQTLKTFNEKKKSYSEILQEIQTPEETKNKLLEEKQDKESEEKRENKFAKTLVDIKNAGAKVMKDANTTMSKITPYLVEGPDMVVSFINNAINEQVTKIEQETNNKTLAWSKEFDKECAAKGELLGEKMANEYNEELKKQAQKMLANIEKSKSSAKNKAFASLQSSKLKIMAMTGVNIPV